MLKSPKGKRPPRWLYLRCHGTKSRCGQSRSCLEALGKNQVQVSFKLLWGVRSCASIHSLLAESWASLCAAGNWNNLHSFQGLLGLQTNNSTRRPFFTQLNFCFLFFSLPPVENKKVIWGYLLQHVTIKMITARQKAISWTGEAAGSVCASAIHGWSTIPSKPAVYIHFPMVHLGLSLPSCMRHPCWHSHRHNVKPS